MATGTQVDSVVASESAATTNSNTVVPARGSLWDNAGDIVTQALLEIGLPNPGPDPFTSVDSNVVQACALLSSCGKSLVHMRQWTHLIQEWSFTTVANQGQYPFPPDYHNMIDQSGWNRTNRLPLGGPMSPQEWQYLKARLVGVVFTVLFRPRDQSIFIYPDVNTPGGYQISFEYVSKWWVSSVATPNQPSSDYPQNSSDLVWFDSQLIMQFLKLKFMQAKGFDTTALQQDFDETFERVCGDDAPSPILNLNRQMTALREPLIGAQSVPITGYGS